MPELRERSELPVFSSTMKSTDETMKYLFVDKLKTKTS